MNTRKYALLSLTLAFAFSAANSAGLAAALGVADAPTGGTLGATLDETAENAPTTDQDSVSGTISADDSSIVTVILSGASFLLDVVAGVALLPLTLQSLGLPSYFAIPAGAVMQIITSIGVVEFASGRVYD